MSPILPQPVFSIIMPCYNMASTVRQAAASVLASTIREIELIIVDDGSQDDSLAIIREMSMKDTRIKVIHQANQGVSAARNTALRAAQGTYILPLDADDMISEGFLEKAAVILDRRPEVRVIVPRSVFFGERSGEWRLPEFSLRKLAHRNIIPVQSIFRRSDALSIGGYCEQIIAREDWEFWIHLLKDGGQVVRLEDEIGLRYRIRKDSKRKRDRKLKRHVIDTLNRRHPEFFLRELGGPLRYFRSWSRPFNRLMALLGF